jgi:hypothetical protein
MNVPTRVHTKRAWNRTQVSQNRFLRNIGSRAQTASPLSVDPPGGGGGSATPCAFFLLLGPPSFPFILLFSTTLLTGMTGQLLAHAMASDLTVAWQFSKKRTIV